MREATVPFLDLKRRVKAIQPRLEAEVARVFDRGRFILGESGAEIERELAKYCGVAHGVGVASGTDALWLALSALGVGPGDEVVTVSNTCAPTIAAVLQAGATPVLVDVDPRTLTMDPARAEAALTPRSKCLLPVHLYGQCADLGAFRDLTQRRGLVLLEDCAQAHGAEHGGRRSGSMGHAGCFSFYPTKNLWALGDGGMVVTDDPSVAQRLRLLRNYGYGEPNRSVLKGHNSRLDEVQAAVLLAGLSRLDEWNERRRSIAARYSGAFQGSAISPPVEADGARHVYHLNVVRSPKRERVREALHQRGIETMIHYPVPVHRQEGYAGLVRIGPGGLAFTERLASEVFSLPLYPEITDREVDRVIEAVVAASGSRG